MLEKYPDLHYIGYLIEKGFDWKVTNSSGLQAADYLSYNGLQKEAIDILNGLSAKMQISIRRSSGGTFCMGRDDCTDPPTFQLSCPHKSIYKACSKCFVKCFEIAKCGCDDEEVASAIPAHDGITVQKDSTQIKHEVIDLEDSAQVLHVKYKW